MTLEEVRQKFLEMETEQFVDWLFNNFNELPIELQNALIVYIMENGLETANRYLEAKIRIYEEIYRLIVDVDRILREAEDQIKLRELRELIKKIKGEEQDKEK